MGRQHHVLPPTLAPIGIDRIAAAEYVGISETLFDRMVAGGLMPQPRIVGRRLVWDVEELTRAFRQIPHRSEPIDAIGASGNPWD